ncbi:STAS domain-containing protein [Streptomyces canus]|uniref:STAS domain-containing protein n=1 Tax=Streptomyces canus TaxID=58343 RepID=UPI003403A8CC
MDRETASGGRLRISSTMAGDRVAVLVVGEVDELTLPQLSAELLAAVIGGPRWGEVDFRQVSLCDCSGLNALLSARQHAQEAGVRFGVSDPVTPVVERLFSLTGVDVVLRS